MRIPKFDRPSFLHNLERTLTNRGLNPSTLNLERLTSDLLDAVADAEHKSPQAILNELGGRFRATLPAYEKTKPSGPRLPAADNIQPHTPDVDDADYLVSQRPAFHVDAWLDAFASLEQWATTHTEAETHTLNLEQALTDLLIEHPGVGIGERTARSLAGQVGMDRLSEVLAASNRERYYLAVPEPEGQLPIDLTAGPSVWNL